MSGKRSDCLKPSGLWVSDAADRIDDGDAMVLNHAALKATIHGHQLGAALVALLKSDHPIHRDVRDKLIELIDAGVDPDSTKPVALEIKCRDKTAEGPITRRGRALFDTLMTWVDQVRAKAPAETWTAWRGRLELSRDQEKERRAYASPILEIIHRDAPAMHPRILALGLPVAERMLQERLVWASIGSERAIAKAKNDKRRGS